MLMTTFTMTFHFSLASTLASLTRIMLSYKYYNHIQSKKIIISKVIIVILIIKSVHRAYNVAPLYP